MNEAQTLALLAALRAAFPRQRFDKETAAVYLAALSDLDADVAQRAVQELIRTSSYFPTIAEIREEHRRFWNSRPKPQALNEPEPSVEERERVAATMRGWVGERFGGYEEVQPELATAGLEEAPPGVCDDCRTEVRLRWKFGKVIVCHGCLSSRRKVGRAAELAGRKP